ncbi:MAG: NAD-dependent epimerase/dehydratase family protein [Kiritimatiellaeota bacterium]|nr:NAD-dependent epimerase/dehydratase family protein [Kiritimatiellota bacterium]
MANAYLVTGAAGFIGSRVALRLLEQGRRVVGLDNFNDYYDVALKEARHARLEAFPEYRGVRGDLCDYPLLQKLFREEEFDSVIHLAAQAGVRHSVDHPFTYLKSNLEGFLGILETCRHARVRRLVYASSSSVYGSNTDLPFSEDDRVDHPLSLYGATKRSNELMAHAYTHLYDLQTIGLRFFTVYGPWGRPDMAMWIFAERITHGQPIPVFNQGKMRRDFTYIDDIVSGVLGAVFAPELNRFDIFNLGNHRCEELMDVIGLIETALGRKAELDLLPMQPGDVTATYADVSRAQEHLGFSPTTSIREGVPRFIEWFRRYRGLSD